MIIIVERGEIMHTWIIATSEVTAVTTLIGNWGFPIAMCLLLFVTMKEQSKQHKSEMDSITSALNNNTLVLQKLVDRLDSIKEDIKSD